MKTISIGAQSSAAELVTALAAALAAEIGWTAEKDENGNYTGNVKKSGIDIYFRVYSNGNTVYIIVTNGYANLTGESVPFTAANTYKLYIFESTGGSIAVGVSLSTANIKLYCLIVRNTAGVYVGINLYSNGIQTIRGVETSARLMTLSINSGGEVSTAIMRMADIWGDSMFTDLYYVVSCPYQNTDRVFYIEGKTYRSVGTNSGFMYFALPGT